tara:strand:+ start:114 stop:1181 length:1068 start_codon:yes stop_codon:yes gene_type:complete
MGLRNEELNRNAQPIRQHKIFNNWDVVTKGWYSTILSKQLKVKQAKTIDLNGHKLMVYRGESGAVHCLDAFCPHMGVDLSLGKVIGEEIRCFFHHWTFDNKARCTHIPCGESPPKKLRLNAYATQEKYGLIWIYPEPETVEPLLEVPALENKETVYKLDKPYYRTCHYHITMINGIDPQHLKTVHNIHMDMDVDIDESKANHIEITLRGKFPTTTLRERIGKKFLGDSYSYSMKYADGCLAALTVMKEAKLFGRYALPELHMYFAYSLVEKGKVSVRPIYVTERSGWGAIGALWDFLKLNMTKLLFKMLQGEDGLVYENIRFNTEAFLKLDAPIVKYLRYINRLEPSVWSQRSLE